MAGTNNQFNPTTFRDGILFAMNMGMPNNVAEQCTFYFKSTRSFPPGTALDDNGEPYDVSVAVVEVEPTPVIVPVAVEFDKAEASELPAGVLRHTKVTLTILDTYWPQVSSAIEISLGRDRYFIEYEKPVLGLFDVDVHQLVCYAKDET